MFARLSKLRHARGFGVHSPLAFELLTSVLPDKPRFYGDEVIKSTFATPRMRRKARVILRLMAKFRPKTVFCDPTFLRVVKIADSRVSIVAKPDEADLAITSEGELLALRIGYKTEISGPLILDNKKDMKITVYRRGLSPTLIVTNL